ncbi:hypothetical protein KJ903_05905 [Patescibacteria group bacterium]|nr:hypothetical protein [Patescibacteria group bacterium]
MKNLASILFLVGANCLPLGGVLFLGWDIPTVLFVYWLESMIIWLFSAIKLFMAGYKSGVMIYGAMMFTITYPILLYVFFLVIRATVMMMSGDTITAANNPYSSSVIDQVIYLFTNFSGSIIFSVISLLTSHTYSFCTNFLKKKEYKSDRHQTFSDLIYAPYKRVVTMYVTLLGGSILVVVFSAPQAFIAVLVIMKTLADILAHMVEHGMINRARLARSSWLVIFGAPKH